MCPRTLRLQRNIYGGPQTMATLTHNISWESCISWGEGVQQDTDAAYQWFTKAYYGGHTYAGMFMDHIDRGEQHPPSVMLSVTRLLYHMGNIFRDNAPAPTANGVQIDRKRLQELQRKRIALGHKPDDHELEQQQGYSMQFR